MLLDKHGHEPSPHIKMTTP